MILENQKPIPVYAINLLKRKERKTNLLQEFNNRNEFELNIVPAIEHKQGVFGLWKTIRLIIKKAKKNKLDFFILCEDDHTFTPFYNKESFFEQLEFAKSLRADILVGGASWFETAIKIDRNIFWIHKFNGLQFTVVFKSTYNKILNTDFDKIDAADLKISEICESKLMIHPFISIQKEFGYSDVTRKNNTTGYVDELFSKSIETLSILTKIYNYYRTSNCTVIDDYNLDEISVPTYVINLKEREDRLLHIKEQFKNKLEFDLEIVEACKHSIGAVGLWQSIVKIVKAAIEKEEDVIVICEDDHCFTENYNKHSFLKNVLEAYEQGASILAGGIGGFKQAVPINEERYWIDCFYCTQFIVIYKPFFNKILQEQFNDSDTADGKLSEMSSNKMVLYPFVSIQKDFGYSDVTKTNQEHPGLINQHFKITHIRLSIYDKVYHEYIKK